MNKEIKEILEYVLSLTYGNENAIKGINKIEDYITNLQEENEELKDELYSTNQVVNELLDERDRNKKAYNYLNKFIPNEYGVLLTERQWEYVKKILGGDDNE